MPFAILLKTNYLCNKIIHYELTKKLCYYEETVIIHVALLHAIACMGL